MRCAPQWLWCARQRGRAQAQSGDSGCSYGWDGQHGHSTRGSHEPGWPRVQRTWLARQPPSTRQWRLAREQHVGTCQRRQRAWGSRCICQADMHRLDAGARAGTTPVPTEVLVLTAAAAVAMCSEASAAGVANLNSLKRESAQTLQLPSVQTGRGGVGSTEHALGSSPAHAARVAAATRGRRCGGHAHIQGGQLDRCAAAGWRLRL